MEWMFIEAYCAMFYGSSRRTKAEQTEGSASASTISPVGAASTMPGETDVWIARQAYEFATAYDTCGKCGAGFGRRLSLAIVHNGDGGRTVHTAHERDGTPWRIEVDARCRGWRRHRHTALVTEVRGGLQFGPLQPD